MPASAALHSWWPPQHPNLPPCPSTDDHAQISVSLAGIQAHAPVSSTAKHVFKHDLLRMAEWGEKSGGKRLSKA